MTDAPALLPQTVALALERIGSEVKIHDALNEGIAEPYLSNRENLPIIKLSIREARGIVAALTRHEGA